MSERRTAVCNRKRGPTIGEWRKQNQSERKFKRVCTWVYWSVLCATMRDLQSEKKPPGYHKATHAVICCAMAAEKVTEATKAMKAVKPTKAIKKAMKKAMRKATKAMKKVHKSSWSTVAYGKKYKDVQSEKDWSFKGWSFEKAAPAIVCKTKWHETVRN